jgi:hypothetical protein
MARRSYAEIGEKWGMTKAQVLEAKGLGVNPYDDDAMRLWAAKHRGEGGGLEVFETMKDLEQALLGAPDLGTAQKLKTQVSGLKDVIAAQKASGELVPVAKVDERDTRIAAAVKGSLLKLANDSPPMLEGLPADKVQKVLRDQVMGILEQLANDQSEFWKEHV